MFELAKAAQARGIAKWCACALILLAPGSFVVLPLLWLARYWTQRGSGSKRFPEHAPARTAVPPSSPAALLAE